MKINEAGPPSHLSPAVAAIRAAPASVEATYLSSPNVFIDCIVLANMDGAGE